MLHIVVVGRIVNTIVDIVVAVVHAACCSSCSEIIYRIEQNLVSFTMGVICNLYFLYKFRRTKILSEHQNLKI